VNNTYYVYAYLTKEGMPYYIGKGKGYRYKDSNHSVAVPRDPQRIVFLEKNLTEIGAFAIERRMIEWYGRVNKKTGILLNVSKGGGGGCSGPKKKRAQRQYNRSGWNWDLI
jgi:hypothetical protein